jgi:hypothetical protein
MEMCHYNAHLSIYGMGDAPAFMIKGDALVFMIGDGMGDVSAFVIKGDTPLEMYCLLYLHNRRRAIGMCVSLLSEKWACLRY